MLYELLFIGVGVFFGTQIYGLFYPPLSFHCYEDVLHDSKKDFIKTFDRQTQTIPEEENEDIKDDKSFEMLYHE